MGLSLIRLICNKKKEEKKEEKRRWRGIKSGFHLGFDINLLLCYEYI
jgi:hypothetical protein